MMSLYEIIMRHMRVRKNLNDDMRLIEDLGFDSLSMMSLIVDLETSYDISFDDAELLFDNFNRIGDLRQVITNLSEGK